MSVPQYKTSITNRKDLDGIQYHHGLGEGLFYGNQTTSKSFLAYDKTLIKQFHFYSGPSSTLRFSSQIAIANHQPECRPLGKVILRHFSCALRTSPDKRFGAGSRGVPEPIQPMSLLNPGLWRLLAGFFPKAGIRLPLLRNFSQYAQAPLGIFRHSERVVGKAVCQFRKCMCKKSAVTRRPIQGGITALRTSGL